ncbi:hypothetical protein [Altericista sp. CCNU0014]|uniref:hypothetical protein n=1 Tax=Altericista sp. CCNU0014 TaxID=3082949 RepID=UPI00384E9C54
MINLIWWKFEPNYAYEYDWLCLLLSGFKVNHIVDFENRVCVDNAIVVANLSQSFFMGSGAQKSYSEERQQFYDYIKRFKSAGKKVGLFHLGDEFYRESTKFYQDLDFVFRQYYKEEDCRKYSHCHYLPIGYKSGFSHELVDRSMAERPYLWSFAGHLKGSRFEMMKYAKQISGGKFHATSQWNDPNALSTQDYAGLLNDTKFSLCPMGNYSVDCFRVYESLEAGTIPIIETKSMARALAVLFNPQLILKYGSRDKNFWLRNYQYWEKAYPSDFPCPLIDDWRNLGDLIQSVDIENSSKKIKIWWQDYKKSLIRRVESTVEGAFS